MSFDARAADYDRSDWHVRYAERLAELASPAPGTRVLDAATGTGFAARAVARAVAPSGRVVGVDLSPAMLAKALTIEGVEYVHGDATRLEQFPDESFDMVLCSAGLLYMPADLALAEWRRLLVPGGRVGFSTMREGLPVAARLFREHAAAFGVTFTDPASPLGTIERCVGALSGAGFDSVDVVAESIRFSPSDLSGAWEAHIRSPVYDAVTTLSALDLQELRSRFDTALTTTSDDIQTAEVLYAFAHKPI